MIDWLKRLTAGFGFAFRGIAALLRSELNARMHTAAVALVVALGIWLQISAVEWCLIAFACGLVLSAEALNTAIEKLADRVTTEKDEHIRLVKDVAAAGVLLAAIAAAVVGALVFVPKIFSS